MHNNQIIFLDIDGVLNSTEDSMRKYEAGEKISTDNTSDLCISAFEKLLDRLPDVKIVVSSTWRISFKNGPFKPNSFRNKTWADLLGEKIASRIIDHTGKTIGDDCRGDDIHKWLVDRPTDNWVIIDDDSDMLEHQMCRFIKVNRKFGFTKKHADQTIKLLQGE